MANIHLDIKSVKRSAGQRATAAAAYRAGERIRDERTGKLHNFSRRTDVTHREIFLPAQLGEAPMQWARDRARLWNTAESAEKRRDARVAREFQVALPSELSPPQRLALARGFAQEMADRYGIGVDLAIHDPKAGGDPRNFHAHLLATTREITPWGLGDKAGLDMHAVQRARQGLSDHSEEYTAVRERWAAHMNEAFREANIDERVDHRTLAAQGIDRQPMVYVPMEFYQRQIKGLKPGQIERLREDYRARVAARREVARQLAPAKEVTPAQEQTAAQEPTAAQAHTPAHEPNAAEQSAPAKEPALATEPTPAKEPVAPLEKAIDPRNVEEIRKQAVQSWLRMRAKEAESSLGKGAGSEDSQQRLEEQRSGETLSGELGSDEQHLPGDRSAGEPLARDTDQGQHAERNGDPDRAGDQTHGQVGSSEQDRNYDRVGARDRDHDHDHDRDGDSAASSGYDDDASM